MEIIQCDYDRLAQIAARFSDEANRIEAIQTELKKHMAPLKNGGWVGKGSDAFFTEMDHVVLPVVQRLRSALAEANNVSQRIIIVIKTAEEEASDPFRQPGADTTPSQSNQPANSDSATSPQPSTATPPPRIYIINGINSDGNITINGQVIIGDDDSVAFEQLLEQHGYDPGQVVSTPAIYTSPQTDLSGTNLHGTDFGGLLSPVDWLTDAGSWAINGVTGLGADAVNTVTGTGAYQTVYNVGEVVGEYISGDEGNYTQQLESFIRADLTRNPLLPGQTVWLVGHSGGGAPAANLAGVLETNAGVDVSTVMTLGAPLSNYNAAHQYAENIIQVRHERDYIGGSYLRGGWPFQVPDYVTSITLTEPVDGILAAHGSYMHDPANSQVLLNRLNQQFPELHLSLP